MSHSWSSAPHWKCGIPATVSRVRIPSSPPVIYPAFAGLIFGGYIGRFESFATQLQGSTTSRFWKCKRTKIVTVAPQAKAEGIPSSPPD